MRLKATFCTSVKLHPKKWGINVERGCPKTSYWGQYMGKQGSKYKNAREKKA